MKIQGHFTFNKALEIVIGITIICLVIVRVSIGTLDSELLSNPRNADPVTSRTIPYHEKGVTVYLTGKDSTRISWLLWTEFALTIFLCVLLLLAIKWPPPSLTESFRRKDEEDE